MPLQTDISSTSLRNMLNECRIMSERLTHKADMIHRGLEGTSVYTATTGPEQHVPQSAGDPSFKDFMLQIQYDLHKIDLALDGIASQVVPHSELGLGG